jgi:S-adenosylmethionine:tRNA ribosyltransferase-isomerase
VHRAAAPGTRTADYDYELPAAQIAQIPVEPRDASRLMVVERATGTISHRVFRDLPLLIAPNDLLVVNTTRVVRARLLGHRESGAPAEVLLLGRDADGTWEALVSPGDKLKPGRTVRVSEDLSVEIVGLTDRGSRRVRLHSSLPDADAVERYGHVPLPPYIARADTPADTERYQTVYADTAGSVAAPTAGLHFTPELLAAIRAPRADVVLHVGVGTFKPVAVDDPADHPMHEERYAVSAATAEAIRATRARGGAVWAVGTTTARTLESAAVASRLVGPGEGETRLFIRSPYEFRVVDRLITNFHLPRSTLLMLVAAFAGYDLAMRAYREAVANGYRFFSYGDAMAIL